MDKRNNENKKMATDLSQLLASNLTALETYEVDSLFKHSQICNFKAGETVLLQGHKIEGIYIILEGTVIVTARMMGQGITSLESLHPGHFFSAISFMEEDLCPTSFIADSNVLCLLIPNSYFQNIAIENPQTKYKLYYVIAEQICQRLKTTHDSITTFISDSKMTSLSFVERIIYSLNQPNIVTFEEFGIDKHLLQKNSLYQFFSKEELNQLFNYFVVLDAPKNCKLIQEGDKSAACFVIIYGAIQTCIIKNSKLAKLSVIGPGRLLASLGCIDSTSAFNVTYITCEQTILCKLSASTLQSIKTNHPQLWYKLFSLICCSLTALKKSADKLNIRLHTETYNR